MEALIRGCKSPRLGLVYRHQLKTLKPQRCGLNNYAAMKQVDRVDADLHEQNRHIDWYQEWTLKRGKPLVLKARGPLIRSGPMKALTKWFQPAGVHHVHRTHKVMTDYLRSFAAVPFPYELTYPQTRRRNLYGDAVQDFITTLKSTESPTTPTPDAALGKILESHIPTALAENTQRLLRFDAPLALLDAGLRFNLDEIGKPMSGLQGVRANPLQKLYIAQAPLNRLPKELQEDVPTPRVVKFAGRGDIYDSSLWLGLEPTYTPFHRDPNPNLFVQLCSRKVVRLCPPDDGERIYASVQARLGRPATNSNIRGVEMMEGEERGFLHHEIWWDRSWDEDVARIKNTSMVEATLSAGDALFIPQGWWHSFKSCDKGGWLNGSVNWWFR